MQTPHAPRSDAGPSADAAQASGASASGGLLDARPRLGWEIVLVLAVSLGQSAVYSLLSLLDKLTAGPPLSQQTTSINNSVVLDRPWLDLAYQVCGIVFPMVPALIALYLLRLSGDRARIGYDLKRPGFDLSRGFLAFAGIGVPGVLFYYASVAAGINTHVSTANLAAHWWTIPAYIGLAIMNGVLEEVVMLAFLFTRFARLGLKPWQYVLISAVIRGSYHLYQGFGGAIGNLVMGLVFGWLYLRWKRVTPLVVAHTLLDIASFVGVALLAPYLPQL